ncbi:hypothetical protein F5Y13DRAFT_196933 [Hypoxylon sp. FL1857]|nr:hypothetical protein F5Y13DRAFT_196933 [Hypoxylon sp. FL1857]
MASSQSKDSGGDQPLEGTSQPQASRDRGKNLMPRGPLFSNLDEAFRKIRSKSVSSCNPSQKGLQECESNRDNSKKLPLGDQPADEITPQPQNAIQSLNTSIVGRSLTDSHGASSNRTYLDETDMSFEEQEVGELTTVEPLDDSGSTIDDIPDKYAHYPAEETGVPPRDGVATRLGFRGEETYRYGITLRHYPAGSPPSDLPQTPYIDSPLSRRRSQSMLELNQYSSPLAGSTVSNSQHLLDPDAQADELQQARKPFFPSPLYLSEKRIKKMAKLDDNDDFFSTRSSLHDDTADSSINPFKYDGQHYQESLKRTKEKDVSQALRRASNIGDSGAVDFTPEPSASAVRYQRSELPSNSEYPVASDRKVIDIRVVIGDGAKLGAQEDGYRDMVSRSTKSVRLGNLLHRSFARESTGDCDWVTESTGEGGAEYGEASLRPATFQTTGSSIADYSDDGERKSSGFFGAKFRVLQHPAGKDDSESYELRNLKGSRQQVYLPKSRPLHGTENSGRLFSTSNSILNQVRPSMSRKLSNPFGASDSYRRADLEGNFALKNSRFGPSKYEFRDSQSDYAPTIPHPNTQGTLAGTRPELEFTYPDGFDVESPSSLQQGRTSSQEVEVTPRKHPEIRLVDQYYPVRNGAWWRAEKEAARVTAGPSTTFNGEPISGLSKFDFELLPLDEAQRREKQQREAGEKDETEPAQTRFKRAMSSTSSGGLQTSTPTALRPPIPARRGLVAPHLSINFSTSLDQSCREALQDLSSPFSATSRPNITPLSSRVTKSLLRGASPASTAVTATPAEKKRFFGQFKSRLFTSKNRGRRNISDITDTTVIHHPAVNQSGLSLAAMEELVEPGIPEAAHKLRRKWFIFMTILGIIFPFIAIAVIAGKFNASLQWYTEGEIHNLTIRQRNFIRNIFLFQCCLYTIILSCILAVFTKASA